MTSLSIRTFQMKELGQNYMQVKFQGHCIIRQTFIGVYLGPNIAPEKLKSQKNPQNPKSSAEDPTLNYLFSKLISARGDGLHCS